VVSFKVLFQHLHGGAEENHGDLQSGCLVSRPRFESGISRITSRIANHYIAAFGSLWTWWQNFGFHKSREILHSGIAIH